MLYSMEMEQMAENAKTQMEDVSHIQTDYVTATQIGHVKTMFKVACRRFVGNVLCYDTCNVCVYLTNRSHCTVRVYFNSAQMTS